MQRLRSRPTFVESIFFSFFEEEGRVGSVQAWIALVKRMEREIVALAIAIRGLKRIYVDCVNEALRERVDLSLKDLGIEEPRLPLMDRLAEAIESRGGMIFGRAWESWSSKHRRESSIELAAEIIRCAIEAALYKARLLTF